jgi:hypothetical protein
MCVYIIYIMLRTKIVGGHRHRSFGRSPEHELECWIIHIYIYYYISFIYLFNELFGFDWLIYSIYRHMNLRAAKHSTRQNKTTGIAWRKTQRRPSHISCHEKDVKDGSG